MKFPTSLLFAIATLINLSASFLPLRYRCSHRRKLGKLAVDDKDVALDEAIRLMTGAGGSTETPEQVKSRIQTLVDENEVLLFMKGTASFPQCGFSDTATKILERTVGANNFHTVDVLSDNNIREGVKQFSQWPTIPQLYINGEFVGGSDIMLEMFESGELKDLVKNGSEE